MSEERGLPTEEFAALLSGVGKWAPLIKTVLPLIGKLGAGEEKPEAAAPSAQDSSGGSDPGDAIPTGGGLSAPGDFRGEKDKGPRMPVCDGPSAGWPPPPGPPPAFAPPLPGGPGGKPPGSPGGKPPGSPDAKCRDALLRALAPYLSPARRAALEDFIRIGHIVDALGAIF